MTLVPCPKCKTRRWYWECRTIKCPYCGGCGCRDCHGTGNYRQTREVYCRKCDDYGGYVMVS